MYRMRYISAVKIYLRKHNLRESGPVSRFLCRELGRRPVDLLTLGKQTYLHHISRRPDLLLLGRVHRSKLEVRRAGEAADPPFGRGKAAVEFVPPADIQEGSKIAAEEAEDGIRDVERSRGLGDVYKRQMY